MKGKRNPVAKVLRAAIFKPKIVPSQKVYKRQKIKPIKVISH